MDISAVRHKTLGRLQAIGLPQDAPLPLLEPIAAVRDATEVAQRANVLHIMYSIHLRGPNSAKDFYHLMKNNGWDGFLTERERQVLQSGNVSKQDMTDFSWMKESCKVLLWAGDLIDEDLFESFGECDFSRYYRVMPPHRPVPDYLETFQLRPDDTLVEHLDFYYCLHWFVRARDRGAAALEPPIERSMVVERRRALEWITHDVPWDRVSMDT